MTLTEVALIWSGYSGMISGIRCSTTFITIDPKRPSALAARIAGTPGIPGSACRVPSGTRVTGLRTEPTLKSKTVDDMNRYPVLFRCDATPEIGWEALWQSLTYAAALQRRRRGTYVCGNFAPFPVLPHITRAGNEYVPADHPFGTPEDATFTARMIRKYQVASVVVAGKDLDEGYLKTVEAAGAMLIVIDSENKLRFPGRVVIHPFLGQTAHRFRAHAGTQVLAGGRYPLVRSLFRRQRAMRAIEPRGPVRALLAFGDNDFADQTLIRAKELLGSSKIERVSAAIRIHHPRLDELRDLAASSVGRFEVLTETNDLMTRLVRSQFVLTSGDNWTMEMACVGIPQLILAQEDHHRVNARAIDAEGGATLLGNAEDVTHKQLHDAIGYLLSDELERTTMTRCARRLIDGRGQDRIVNALEIMLHSGRTGSARVAA